MDQAPPAPTSADDWVALSPHELPVSEVADWVVRPYCGATVTFTGTARDHAPGRPDVSRLEYEAYEDQAVRRMEVVVAEARRRWPALGRVAILHRTGEVALGGTAVVVSVSAPHRPEAFEAARWAIDELKRAVPIWKRETWAGGQSWGVDAQPVAGAVSQRADGAA